MLNMQALAHVKGCSYIYIFLRWASLSHARHFRCPSLLILRFSPAYICPRMQCVFLALCLCTLPFETISRMLSAWVPNFKCLGFTHGGLSQICKMHIPLGIGPLAIIQEALCAFIIRGPKRKRPYENLLVLNAFHSQHKLSSLISTFFQNLSINIVYIGRS